MVEQDLNSLLVKLERQLHDPSVRRDKARLAELLHPEFIEFGRSGQSYTFSQMVEHLEVEALAPPSLHAQDFVVRLLGETAALVTYKSAHVTAGGKLERHALRSSLWQRTERGWQMVFHQGTPTSVFVQHST